ncbi:MAG: sulfite exporter TauE/SafE family protein [Nitrospirales bacterium]|nr:sulfite exporter TauE/SafE family protein [Nitrospirales bacterium]
MWTADPLFSLMFSSGLLGGFGHCIGMCGPVVAAYSLQVREHKYIPHFLYNLGRISSYTIVGGIMGVTGSFVGVMGFMEGFQRWFMAAMGLFMVVMGLSSAGLLPFAKRALVSRIEGSRLTGIVMKAFRFLSAEKSMGAYFPMGLVLGFIPCGLLYTAFIGAAAAGAQAEGPVYGLLRGMGMLLSFGLGTAVPLFLLGSVVSLSGKRIRTFFYRASAIVMAVTGVVFIVRALA